MSNEKPRIVDHIAAGLASAVILEETIDRDPMEVYAKIGKLNESEQLYLFQAMMHYRKLVRGVRAMLRRRADEISDYRGIWYQCDVCEVRWLDPFDPPPETEEDCGHSVET